LNIIGCTNHSAKHSLSQGWHTGEQVYFLGFGCGDIGFDRPGSGPHVGIDK
jgi:hypothetical protein